MTLIAQQPSLNPGVGLPRVPPAPRAQGHQYSASSTGLATSKSRRSLAALARDKVVELAGIGTNNPPLRSTTSSGSLQKQSLVAAQNRPQIPRNITSPPAISPQSKQNTEQTLPTRPKMTAPERNSNKMHQIRSDYTNRLP